VGNWYIRIAHEKSHKTWAYVLTLLGSSEVVASSIRGYTSYVTGLRGPAEFSVYAQRFGLGGVPLPKKVMGRLLKWSRDNPDYQER
jgi:hypothetical protein